jgi:hypothetical protein
MKKEQLARRLAKVSHITTAAAADQLDRVLHDILKRVRSGQALLSLVSAPFSPTARMVFSSM